MLQKPVVPTHLPPISILKPIKGIEEGFLDNLNSFVGLNYPKYEVILCLASEQDLAFPILKKFLEDTPLASFSLHIGEEKIGPNPKVNNLSRPYRLAKYDNILISDSNVRASKNYLIDMAQSFDESVGVVTSVVVGQGAKELGGYLESVFLNTYYARWMWICKKLGSPAVIGKSMLFSRKNADRFGGISTLSHFIAEDYMAGQAFEKLGKEVSLSSQPIVQWIGNYTFKDFWNRHLRWGRIRRAQSPLLTLFEPLFFSTVSVALGAFAVYSYSNELLLYFIVFHFCFWALCDVLILKAENALNFYMCLAWFLREFLALPLFIHVCSSSTVNWRGHPLKIKTGGLITALS